MLPGVESSTRAAPQLCGSVPGCTEPGRSWKGRTFFFDEARSLGNEVARLTRRYGSPGLPRLRVARLLRHLVLARKDGGTSGQLMSLLLFSLLSSGAFRLGFGRLVVLCGPHVSSRKLGAPCRMATIHSTSLASEQFVPCSIYLRVFRHFLRTPPRAKF